MSSAKPSGIIRFGVFELDRQAGELRRNGVKIRLQEQPLQVLIALLEHPGEVVSREELRTKLWPADTFVDFDHSLNAAIRRLRDALGESADLPVFIETMARRGYRFIAPVTAPTLGTVPTTPSRTKPQARVWLLAVASVVALLLLGLFARSWLVRNKSSKNVLFERELTTNALENPVTAAVISPDGKYLAYSDTTGVYVKVIKTGETHSVPLPRASQVRPDSWLPDGTHLVATVEEMTRSNSSLWVLSVMGGTPRRLLDNGASAVVSPDGSRVAFLRGVDFSYVSFCPPEFGRPQIWSARTDGTELRRIVSVVGAEWVGPITWSPDGQRIAYVRSALGPDNHSIEASDLQGKSEQILPPTRGLGTALYWAGDNRLFFVLSEKSVNTADDNAWTVGMSKTEGSSRAAVRITQGHGTIPSISGSSQGTIVFLRSNEQRNVYVGSLSEDHSLMNTTRLALDDNSAVPFSWTADSNAVVFNSHRNGGWDIYKQDVDRPFAESVVVSPDRNHGPRLSPNGEEIIYISYHQDKIGSEIMAVRPSGDTPRLILKDDRTMENVQCARSPSRFCVYGTSVEKKELIYQFDPKTGEKKYLLAIPSEMVSFSLSPDGATLAAIDASTDKRSIQFHALPSGQVRQTVVKEWPRIEAIDWAADGKSLFVATSAYAGKSTLLNVTLDGRAKKIREIENHIIHWGIPSPNGRRLAIFESVTASNAWTVESGIE